MALFDRFSAFFATLGMHPGDVLPDAALLTDFLPSLAAEEHADFRALLRVLVEDRWFDAPAPEAPYWQVRLTERGLAALEALEAAAGARRTPTPWLDDLRSGEDPRWGALHQSLTPGKWVSFLVSALVNVIREGRADASTRSKAAALLEQLVGNNAIASQLSRDDTLRIRAILSRAVT